jgi:hypothetical protein
LAGNDSSKMEKNKSRLVSHSAKKIVIDKIVA